MYRRRIRAAAGSILGWLAALLLKTIRRTNPDRMADLGGRLMQTIGPLFPEHRTGRDSLTKAFPEKTPAEIDTILAGVWDNLGRVAAEFAHLDRIWDYDYRRPGPSRIEVTPEILARFLKMRDDGKPALVFTAHIANWELPAVAASALGAETAVLFRRPNLGNIDKMIRDIRSVNMGALIPTSLDAPMKIADALSRGIHVGMLVDQYYVRGVDVTFFGRRTKANPLLARLAQHIDCPIHGVRMIRLPNHRFGIELTEPIAPVRDANGDVDITATTQAITAVIESWIREHPEQWLWLHRRWRDD